MLHVKAEAQLDVGVPDASLLPIGPAKGRKCLAININHKYGGNLLVFHVFPLLLTVDICRQMSTVLPSVTDSVTLCRATAAAFPAVFELRRWQPDRCNTCPISEKDLPIPLEHSALYEP